MGLDELAAVKVTIGAATKPLDDALNSVKSGLASFAKTAGITIGVVGLAKTTFDAAKAAGNLAMEMHRVDAIFGHFAPQVDATIAGLSKAFGYTRAELANMSSSLGEMFIGMNLNEKVTAELTKRFMELGVNASVLHGMDLPEFMERIDAGVAGANRSLKKMGIFITETSVQMEKFRLAGQGVVWMSDEQGDQIARLSLIMKHLASSAGQAEWAHKQFGGTLREVKGRLSEMWIALGEIAKPIWSSIMTGINRVLQQMGEWIDNNKAKFIAFATNIGVYAEIASLYIREAMQKSGVYFGYFIDVAATGLVWLGRNWKEAFIDLGNIVATAFKNIASNIVTFGSWLGENWRELWNDLRNVVTTTLNNLGANFKQFGEAAYNWIKSGFREPFEFKMVGLGAGAAPAQAGALPEFKAILADFKAVSEKFVLPGMPNDKIKEINADFAKRIADVMKKLVAPGRKAGEEGAGIARPGAGMPSRIEPGFVGITEFAKQIQMGALGKDAAVIATARNTQRMAEMMAMFGPRLMDIFMQAGGAVGPM